VSNTWAVMDGLASFDEGSLQHNIIDRSVTVSECYIRSLYFTTTVLSTIGYGDIRPQTKMETIFQLLQILTAACTFAGFVGAIGAYFDCIDKSGKAAFKNEMFKLKVYMCSRKVQCVRRQSCVRLHVQDSILILFSSRGTFY
jgi:hypothetical protein